MVIPNLKFSEMGGGGLSGLRFQKGAFWKIWTKIYCAARNLLVHHSSLSHTTYVETNNAHLSTEWLCGDHIYDKFDAGYVDEADVYQFSA